MNNLTGLFDSVNEEVGDIAAQVGQTPAAWNSSIYSMIHSLSENVIVPIAGLILAFVMTLEFIQMIVDILRTFIDSLQELSKSVCIF